MSPDRKQRCCAICAYPAPKRCAGCGQAHYCSEEHQRLAWDKHKRLCKMYRREDCGEPAPSPNSYCGLCGKSDGPLTKTRCCNRTVCDDSDNYVLFSYSRDSCLRNHDRYTRCSLHADHASESHHGDDFLSCKRCDNTHQGEARAWYMTNSYNFLEDILRSRPPTFAPTSCASCGLPIKLNVDGYSYGRGGHYCESCADKRR